MRKILYRHATAAATTRGLEFCTLVGDMHKKGRWEPAVRGVILPVQDPAKVDTPESCLTLDLMPPKTRRPPRRSPKQRIQSGRENPVS